MNERKDGGSESSCDREEIVKRRVKIYLLDVLIRRGYEAEEILTILELFEREVK